VNNTLSNIENIVGTDFNDTLVGYAGANIIEGAGRYSQGGVGYLYMESQLLAVTQSLTLVGMTSFRSLLLALVAA